MLPDRVSNPGPLTYESGALPIALRGPAKEITLTAILDLTTFSDSHNLLKEGLIVLLSKFYGHYALIYMLSLVPYN